MASDGKAEGEVEQGLFASQPQWTSPVFFSGLFIGGLLIVGGFASEMFGIGTRSMALLVLAGGLGIILGAFGATALLRYQGLTVTGVGVLAIVLYQLLTGDSGKHLIIALKGLPKDGVASLYADAEVHGGLRDRRYEFILLAKTVAAPSMDLSLSWKVAGAEQTALFPCVPVEEIRSKIGSGETTEWNFSATEQTLTVGSKTLKSGCPQAVAMAPIRLDFGFVGSAVAQEAAKLDVPTLLVDLEADSLPIRRAARQGLTEAGVEAVPDMMRYWALDPDNYRRGLGVSVALTELLRDDKGLADDIVKKLEPQDYQLLVDAIADPDRTKQIYATEFLFDLGAPASTEAIVEAFPAASQEGQFNSVFVLTNVVGKLGATEKQELADKVAGWKTLPTLGTKTEAELDKLLGQLK